MTDPSPPRRRSATTRQRLTDDVKASAAFLDADLVGVCRLEAGGSTMTGLVAGRRPAEPGSGGDLARV